MYECNDEIEVIAESLCKLTEQVEISKNINIISVNEVNFAPMEIVCYILFLYIVCLELYR